MKPAVALACLAALALTSGCSTYYDSAYYRARAYSTPGPYVADDGYTQAWLDSCSRRYRSFDPATGTYLGYDGLVHRCVL
jgi:hypothetical protein